MEPYGAYGPYMAFNGLIWPYGALWSPMELIGRLWPYMAFNGLIWPYGALWSIIAGLYLSQLEDCKTSWRKGPRTGESWGDSGGTYN